MFKFGFELEGFFLVNGEVSIPPKNYPTDGFPGLCEVRTTGGKDLTDAYFELLKQFSLFPFDFSIYQHTFTPQQKRLLRGRINVKDGVEINNIYGKEPRALGNKCIGSLQINISNEIRSAYTDDKGYHHPARYGLFDFRPIVERLDREFKKEIEEAKRQPGFYSVKDGCRVEYRSLPNCIFSTKIEEINFLLKRIKSACD